MDGTTKVKNIVEFTREEILVIQDFLWTYLDADERPAGDSKVLHEFDTLLRHFLQKVE